MDALPIEYPSQMVVHNLILQSLLQSLLCSGCYSYCSSTYTGCCVQLLMYHSGKCQRHYDWLWPINVFQCHSGSFDFYVTMTLTKVTLPWQRQWQWQRQRWAASGRATLRRRWSAEVKIVNNEAKIKSLPLFCHSACWMLWMLWSLPFQSSSLWHSSTAACRWYYCYLCVTPQVKVIIWLWFDYYS